MIEIVSTKLHGLDIGCQLRWLVLLMAMAVEARFTQFNVSYTEEATNLTGKTLTLLGKIVFKGFTHKGTIRFLRGWFGGEHFCGGSIISK